MDWYRRNLPSHPDDLPPEVCEYCGMVNCECDLMYELDRDSY